jgi:F0F1-type ATP synthase assembly protein I
MEKEKKSDNWSALSFAWELGYSITLPLVIFALVGRFLDKKFATSPLFLLSGIVFSIIITSIIVYRKVMSIINKNQ